jgi:hypothetical protein
MANQCLNDDLRSSFVRRLRFAGFELFTAPTEVRADRQCVLAAVGSYSYALRAASEELRGDPEIVSIAVKSHGHAIRWASSDLRNDPSCALLAIASQAEALHHCPILRTDRSFLLKAVSVNGFVAEGGHFTRKMKEDETFMNQVDEALQIFRKKGRES